MRKFIFWLAGLLLLMIGTVLWGRSSWVICWDSIDVDEPLLQELCGISRAEYFSADFDPSSCPEAEQALRMVGGCDTDWGTVIIFTSVVCMLYLIASAVLFLFIRWRNKVPHNNQT